MSSTASAASTEEDDVVTKHDQKDPTFWRLPAEIRNEIYKLAFETADLHCHALPLEWERASDTVLWEVEPEYTLSRTLPAMLSVCRQMYMESKVFVTEFTAVTIAGDVPFCELVSTIESRKEYLRDVKVLCLALEIQEDMVMEYFLVPSWCCGDIQRGWAVQLSKMLPALQEVILSDNIGRNETKRKILEDCFFGLPGVSFTYVADV